MRLLLIRLVCLAFVVVVFVPGDDFTCFKLLAPFLHLGFSPGGGVVGSVGVHLASDLVEIPETEHAYIDRLVVQACYEFFRGPITQLLC